MKFTTEFCEREYNARAAIPDHAAIFARWTDRAATTRRLRACLIDLPYGDTAHEKLDLFAARSDGAPLLVFIHGGYWRSLDKSDFSFVAPAFNAAGALVLVPNYALCPAVTIEHIALQMAQAVAWAVDHAAEHGGDPARIALAGHSAGGHLAAMLLTCRWKEIDPGLPVQPLAGALSISGLYDLEPLRHTPGVQRDLRLTPAALRTLCGTVARRLAEVSTLLEAGDTEVIGRHLFPAQTWRA